MAISEVSGPTGVQYAIAAGGFTAVVTEIGAGLRSFRRAGRPLVMEFPEDSAPVGASGELLIPWPNRIGDGQYVFDGEKQQLDITEPERNNAIHGLSRHLPWMLAEHADSSVRLDLRLGEHEGYPHVLDLTVEYALDEHRGLIVTASATNAGGSAAPYGIGSHAYLRIEGGLDQDGALLKLPADSWLPVDEQMLPTGKSAVAEGEYDFRDGGRSLRGVVLDTAFTDLTRDADGMVRVSLGRGAGSGTDSDHEDGGRRDGRGDESVTMWFGAGLNWVQLFSGDPLDDPYRRSALAVEPMSCPPNAFVSGEGVIRLEPGDSVTHTWGIYPSR